MPVYRVSPLRIGVVLLVMVSQSAMAGNPIQLPKPPGRPIFQTPPIDIPRRPAQQPHYVPPTVARPQAGPSRPSIPQQPSRPNSPWGYFPGDV